MKLGIMQPYFFPYIGYFQLIHAVDTFMLYDNVNYIKNGWMNRNRVLAKKHEPAFIIAPIRKESKSSYRKIRDVKLAPTAWRGPLLKHLNRAYRRSRYFDDIYPLLERILAFDTVSLSALNKKAIVDLCRFLDIDTQIVDDVSRFEPLEARLQQEEKTPARKTLRILELCRALGADTYINAIGGQKLYDRQAFRDNGIALFFVKTLDFSYPQPADTFHPNLSIIDVLMHCGKEKTKDLLTRYELI